MRRFGKRWKRKSNYSKSLILVTVLFLLLGGIFLGYVYNSMIIYERNLVDNYIKYLATSGKLTEKIDNDLFAVSKYEKKNAKITDGIKKVLKSKDLVIKKDTKESKDGIFVYNLLIKDNTICTVSLKSAKKYRRMAILTIDEWEVVDTKTYFDNGVYKYEITIPSDYKLMVNNTEASDEDIKEEGDEKGLERLTKYIEINKSKTYDINNLVYEPSIKIKDSNNKEVQYEEKDGKIIVSKKYKEVATLDEAKEYIKGDFNILKFAENYSLFLTNDFHGRSGFNYISTNLIKDSYMYEYLHGWATQVDITFVSNHRLKNPVFTNEEVKNFIIYNDNAFSVEVYLEKNMTVNGQDRVDKMHDRLYFIYYENSYRLVDMKSI